MGGHRVHPTHSQGVSEGFLEEIIKPKFEKYGRIFQAEWCVGEECCRQREPCVQRTEEYSWSCKGMAWGFSGGGLGWEIRLEKRVWVRPQQDLQCFAKDEE